MFIPDLDFLPIPDSGSGGKRAKDPGSGPATLLTGLSLPMPGAYEVRKKRARK